MKSFAQTLELKDDPKLITEYLAYHEKVWPEVMKAIQSMGVNSMKIFIHGNRLFMYAEAGDDFDPAKDYQKYTESAKAREWDELMRNYQQKVPAASESPDEWWSPMTLCFDLQAQTAALGHTSA
eukprot:TRINITY_DN4102_c0_g1_i1.p2 TRINITY_DN4102_c0_g1~~TRINITY_DN4102_c0_g1_i1.p2  ORF type:complete len:124 (-),score=16.78 TRINITY_DN4102_c0_g1_i1:432-803(-)